MQFSPQQQPRCSALAPGWGAHLHVSHWQVAALEVACLSSEFVMMYSLWVEGHLLPSQQVDASIHQSLHKIFVPAADSSALGRVGLLSASLNQTDHAFTRLRFLFVWAQDARRSVFLNADEGNGVVAMMIDQALHTEFV